MFTDLLQFTLKKCHLNYFYISSVNQGWKRYYFAFSELCIFVYILLRIRPSHSDLRIGFYQPALYVKQVDGEIAVKYVF